MPVIGPAPDVIPIPELSEREKRERLDELEEAVKLHADIRTKIQRVLPFLDEIIQDCVKFQLKCGSSYLLRSIHLSRALRFAVLFNLVASVRTQLSAAAKASEKVERRSKDLEREILDPDLPGVPRDPREVREMLKLMSESQKAG